MSGKKCVQMSSNHQHHHLLQYLKRMRAELLVADVDVVMAAAAARSATSAHQMGDTEISAAPVPQAAAFAAPSADIPFLPASAGTPPKGSDRHAGMPSPTAPRRRYRRQRRRPSGERRLEPEALSRPEPRLDGGVAVEVGQVGRVQTAAPLPPGPPAARRNALIVLVVHLPPPPPRPRRPKSI